MHLHPTPCTPHRARAARSLCWRRPASAAGPQAGSQQAAARQSTPPAASQPWQPAAPPSRRHCLRASSSTGPPAGGGGSRSRAAPRTRVRRGDRVGNRRAIHHAQTGGWPVLRGSEPGPPVARAWAPSGGCPISCPPLLLPPPRCLCRAGARRSANQPAYSSNIRRSLARSSGTELLRVVARSCSPSHFAHTSGTATASRVRALRRGADAAPRCCCCCCCCSLPSDCPLHPPSAPCELTGRL